MRSIAKLGNVFAALVFAISCNQPVLITPSPTVNPTLVSTQTPIPTTTQAPQPAFPPLTQPTTTTKPEKLISLPPYVDTPLGRFIVDPDGAVRRRDSDQPLFTFDDCEINPGQGTVAKYISVLQEFGIKDAIFFPYNTRCYSNPTYSYLISEIKKAGYTIGNHGWNHRDMVTLYLLQGDGELEHEIRDGAHESIFLRPPRGQIDPHVINRIWLDGYTPTMWAVDSKDALNGRRYTCDQLLQNLQATKNIRGAIVLMHMQIAQSPDALRAYLGGKKSCY